MSVVDSITLALAIVGATGTLVQAYSTWRDRPRLLLNFGTTTAVEQKPSIWMEITNAGYRPATVREVGFYAKKIGFETIRDGEPHLQGEGDVEFKFAKSVFLEAGQSQMFESRPDSLSWGLHADFPLRAYALDIRARRIWGGAAPLVRMMVGDEPPLHDDDPEDLKLVFAPHDDRILPTQVEPRWKIWKRKELRRPSAWPTDRRARMKPS